MFFLWIQIPNTIYNKNPMDATLSSLSVFYYWHNSKMATPKNSDLMVLALSQLIYGILGDLEVWFI